MDTQLIAQIFEICIIPILGVLTTFLISSESLPPTIYIP